MTVIYVLLYVNSNDVFLLYSVMYFCSTFFYGGRRNV